MNYIFIALLSVSFSTAVHAQDTSDSSFSEIEKFEQVLETNFPRLDTPTESPSGAPKANIPILEERQKTVFKAIESNALYSDLAVFQKNYMPKSGRLHLSSGIITVPTDVFFLTGGLSLKAAYHFSEAWGIEAFTNLLSSSARGEIDNIKSKQQVSASSLVSLKSFSGLNAYYNFIYGKLSISDTKVLPFEIFNTLGIGTMINSSNYQSSSFQFGLGSLFSLSRSTAVRVDLSWAFYETKNILNKTANENSTFLSLSYSWFFPEPEYR